MGISYVSFDATCRECEKAFSASRGHGRRFQQLRCDACGDTLLVGHEEIADLHRRFMIAADKAGEIDDWEEGSRAFDRASDEFREGVEAFAGKCSCGGRFRYGAPIRCPSCCSTDVEQGEIRRLYV